MVKVNEAEQEEQGMLQAQLEPVLLKVFFKYLAGTLRTGKFLKDHKDRMKNTVKRHRYVVARKAL